MSQQAIKRLSRHKTNLLTLKNLTFNALIFAAALASYTAAFASDPRPSAIDNIAFDTTPGITILARADKNIAWERATALRADLTGDGKKEQVFLGKGNDKIFIGIIAGTATGTSKPWKLEFSTDKLHENALCSTEVNITTEVPSLPLEAFGCDVESRSHRCAELRKLDRTFQHLAKRKASGIILEDGLCDPFHIYWDIEKKLFRWWRF